MVADVAVAEATVPSSVVTGCAAVLNAPHTLSSMAIAITNALRR
jgi:hypothetical protein